MIVLMQPYSVELVTLFVVWHLTFNPDTNEKGRNKIISRLKEYIPRAVCDTILRAYTLYGDLK